MLRTSLSEEPKTGDNTRKRVFAISLHYGIDPNEYHIARVTDNGSNLASGLHRFLPDATLCTLFFLRWKSASLLHLSLS